MHTTCVFPFHSFSTRFCSLFSFFLLQSLPCMLYHCCVLVFRKHHRTITDRWQGLGHVGRETMLS